MKIFSFKIGGRILLVLCFLLAVLKILLVGFDIDEQYAVAMSFRLLKGDFLLLDMWEPHQTSGFLCALLMMPYLAFTKSTTGIFLYLRVCGMLIHFGTFFLVRRFLCQIFNQTCNNNRDTASLYATLIACIYFFTLPKIMFLPEFSNLQVWLLILSVIFLTRYYICYTEESARSSLLYLLLAGFCIMLEVLSYPSTILVFFFCIYCIIRFRHRHDLIQTIKELTAFVLPCFLGVLIFCGYLLSHMNLEELFELLPIVASDGSHSASLVYKVTSNLPALKELFLFAIIYGAISALMLIFLRKRRVASCQPVFLNWSILFLTVTLLGQLLIWVAGNHYPNYPHAEYFFLLLIMALWAIREKITADPLFAFSFTMPLVAFCGILLFTNHPLLVSAPFLGPCTVGGLTLMSKYIMTNKDTFRLRKMLNLLLVLWTGVLLFGNLYLVRTTGGLHYTAFNSLSLMRQGPAVGIIADSNTVKRYNAAATILTENIPDKANVFYAGSSSAIYLQRNMEICTPSTISTPTYDEKISLYFALHPQKAPMYIICDTEQPDRNNYGWLADYIQTVCEEDPIAGNYFFTIYKVSNPFLE